MRFTKNLGLAANCHTREIPSFRPGICEICWLCRPSLRMPRAHGELNKVNLLSRDFARETAETAFARKSGVRADDRVESVGVEGTHMLVRIMHQKPSISSRGRTPTGLVAALTTHRHRRCPYCHGEVYREKRRGLAKLTLVLAVRPYRCADCDRLHYGFCF